MRIEGFGGVFLCRHRFALFLDLSLVHDFVLELIGLDCHFGFSKIMIPASGSHLNPRLTCFQTAVFANTRLLLDFCTELFYI
jgi:hypothetical protein